MALKVFDGIGFFFWFKVSSLLVHGLWFEVRVYWSLVGGLVYRPIFWLFHLLLLKVFVIFGSSNVMCHNS